MIDVGQIEFGESVTLLFFAVTAITVAIFIEVATKWPHLMQKWTEVDKALSQSYGFPSGLHHELKLIAFVIVAAAIAEHSLFLAFTFKYSKSGETLSETIQLYFEHRFDQVFNIFPFCMPLGIITQIVNTFSTVSWNFMDLFIMLVSLALSARFKQVVVHISQLTKNNENDEEVWRQVREDYTRLAVLCAKVDDTISNIMLLSFSNNIFVVIVQLYFSLQRPPISGALDKIYYVYSFLFLILRTIAVALYAATIHTESKKPQHYLNTLSSDIYSVEIERFLYQVKYNTIALTGHKLFKVNRSLILRVAGAIVSYELVLIQFNVA
ncbi:gustatory receptor for sugar taste 64f-like [Zophobas morio]